MGTIKLRRGSGTPAGSLAQYEVAMDVAAKNLYTSTDGSDAVILADNTLNTLSALPDDTMSISGSAQSLTDAVVNIVTDNSGYNKAQIMCEDSNAKVFSIVGESDDVNQNRDKFIVSLDPDNIHSPNNVTTYPGDYGVYYLKEYANINNPAIEMNVFGAKDGFKLRIFDDNNSSSPNPGPLGYGGYGFKPFQVYAENFEVHAKSSDTSADRVLEVDTTEAAFEVPIKNANLSADPANPQNGWQYYNTTTHKLRLYANGAWVDLN